jgi:leader peptidase (prepilin peptidase)/N-methyltransferase
MGFWIGLLVMAYFTLVSVIDIEHRIIMHPVSIVGAIIGFLVGVWQHGWKATLLGGIFGLGLMLIIFYGGSLFVKWISKIKKNETNEEAFGFGDVVLSGVLGLFLGWPGIVGGVILAILLGGIGSLIVISISFITKKYHAFMAIPYGPFLLLGAAILLFQPGL